MKKLIAVGLLSIFCCHLQAQTKRIAHRSHSGKNSTLIMTTGDNFGLPRPKPDTTKKPVAVITKKKVVKKKVTVKTKGGK